MLSREGIGVMTFIYDIRKTIEFEIDNTKHIIIYIYLKKKQIMATLYLSKRPTEFKNMTLDSTS